MAYTSIFQQIEDVGMHLILPVITLTLVSFAEYLMIMRNSLVDVMTEDFVLTARAKGLTEQQVLRRSCCPECAVAFSHNIAIALVSSSAGHCRRR